MFELKFVSFEKFRVRLLVLLVILSLVIGLMLEECSMMCFVIFVSVMLDYVVVSIVEIFVVVVVEIFVKFVVLKIVV